MAANESNSNWFDLTAAVATITITTTVAIAIFISNRLRFSIKELQVSLKIAEEKCQAERQGRIRAQQDLRKSLMQDKLDKSKSSSYPMTPIAYIQSCFSTRNGTPRQPLLVPLARACMAFDTSQVPPSALEGLEGYSHVWILYIFHLNTNLEKLWKDPARSKYKAKVRVPALSGGTMGVFATRSPHRPNPIGLTVAKIEAVQGHMVLLSGVDLVDGTPVLDIKPYLPYCDSVQGVRVPKWVKVDNLLAVSSVTFSPEFSSSLAYCWATAEESSLYKSPDEFQSLIKQVLSWDIRSLAQRKRPHNALLKTESGLVRLTSSNSEDEEEMEQDPNPLRKVTYHLMLEGLEISYKIDHDGNIAVKKAAFWPVKRKTRRKLSNYTAWRGILN